MNANLARLREVLELHLDDPPSWTCPLKYFPEAFPDTFSWVNPNDPTQGVKLNENLEQELVFFSMAEFIGVSSEQYEQLVRLGDSFPHSPKDIIRELDSLV